MQLSSQPDAFGLVPNSRAESHAFFVVDAISKPPDGEASFGSAEPAKQAPDELQPSDREQVDAPREAVRTAATAPDGVTPTTADEPDESSLSEWKHEVAACVNRYRTRRPRTPRYPSLSLKFDAPRFETDRRDLGEDATSAAVDDSARTIPIILQSALIDETIAYVPSAEPTARILEFPRPAHMPPLMPADAIADPVMDRPRILDVPEMMPPAPALGGIHIEAEAVALERRPGFEIPLQPASFARRLQAGVLDAMLVMVSVVAFGAIFFRMTHSLLALRETVVAMGGVGASLWLMYQHFLLVCSGSTVGLRCAELELRKFDGRGVSRSTRFLRTLAALLSAASLGLGYLWCFLDEDQLCWHDRITRTYMAPKDTVASAR